MKTISTQLMMALMIILMASATLAETVSTPNTGNSIVMAEEPINIEKLRLMLVKSIGAVDTTVEIAIKNNIFTVVRVNSNMNTSSQGGLNNEAQSIATIVAMELHKDTRYDDIFTIRVQYITRTHPTGSVHIIDTVNFRKNEAGAFLLHAS